MVYTLGGIFGAYTGQTRAGSTPLVHYAVSYIKLEVCEIVSGQKWEKPFHSIL